MLPGSQQYAEWRPTEAAGDSSTNRPGQPMWLPHRQGGHQDQGDQRGEISANISICGQLLKIITLFYFNYNNCILIAVITLFLKIVITLFIHYNQ